MILLKNKNITLSYIFINYWINGWYNNINVKKLKKNNFDHKFNTQ